MVAVFEVFCSRLVFVSGKFVLSFASISQVVLLFFSLLTNAVMVYRAGRITMYHKIMVPVDESAAAMRALQEAIMLAKLCNAVLRVVNVVDLAQFSWGGVGALPSEEVRKAVNATGKKGLEQAEKMLEESGMQYEIEVLESAGDKVADMLIQEATEHNVDLLVMGTHGFSGFMHILMGSVAEGVLRQSDIPVMLLRVRDDD